MKKIYAAHCNLTAIIAAVILAILCSSGAALAQQDMVTIYVPTPDYRHEAYKPVGDVMARSIMREFKRSGGMQIIEHRTADEMLAGKGFKGQVSDRERALEAGRIVGADIIIFSTIRHKHDDFVYTIAFLEVERDVIQRTLKGEFRDSSSPMEIERAMKEQAQHILKYVPLPSELADFGSVIRQNAIDYTNLPPDAEISDIPQSARYGKVEQVMNYFRVFPGEEEYVKFERQRRMTRFQSRPDLDEELTHVLNQFYIQGDFAIRHNMQAFLIKDCSPRAINVLIANGIPVFVMKSVLHSYKGLSPDGFCMYETLTGQDMETLDLSHRMRVAVMFFCPKPGKRNGLSKSYLERAVGHYTDEWGKHPTLVEIKDSMFDIIAGGLE